MKKDHHLPLNKIKMKTKSSEKQLLFIPTMSAENLEAEQILSKLP